jgi:hypothetical protein
MYARTQLVKRTLVPLDVTKLTPQYADLCHCCRKPFSIIHALLFKPDPVLLGLTHAYLYQCVAINIWARRLITGVDDRTGYGP